MNGERRNNVSYHRIIISKGLKIILNPFHKNNEFDLTSVIFEMYAHISLIIVLVIPIIPFPHFPAAQPCIPAFPTTPILQVPFR